MILIFQYVRNITSFICKQKQKSKNKNKKTKNFLAENKNNNFSLYIFENRKIEQNQQLWRHHDVIHNVFVFLFIYEKKTSISLP